MDSSEFQKAAATKQNEGRKANIFLRILRKTESGDITSIRCYLIYNFMWEISGMYRGYRIYQKHEEVLDDWASWRTGDKVEFVWAIICMVLMPSLAVGYVILEVMRWREKRGDEEAEGEER